MEVPKTRRASSSTQTHAVTQLATSMSHNPPAQSSRSPACVGTISSIGTMIFAKGANRRVRAGTFVPLCRPACARFDFKHSLSLTART